MCIASWVVYILIGSNRGSSRDRKSRETKTASYLNRAHLIMMNVLYHIQMYLRMLDFCQIGNHDCDTPALDRDHHIRTYMILSRREKMSLQTNFNYQRNKIDSIEKCFLSIIIFI